MPSITKENTIELNDVLRPEISSENNHFPDNEEEGSFFGKCDSSLF